MTTNPGRLEDITKPVILEVVVWFDSNAIYWVNCF